MPDPNNIVLTGKGLTFMLIPKVANTSIKVAMLNAIGINAKWPGLNGFMANAHANRHIFYTADKAQLSNSDDLKIAFVRNPYDRIMSCYRNKVVQTHHRAFEKYGIWQNISFDQFIRSIERIPDERADQHFRSQYYELYHNDDLVPDFVGRFENLGDDWKKVQHLVDDQCGISLPDLPHTNRSRPIPIEMAESVRDMIARRYANDFEAFGYAV